MADDNKQDFETRVIIPSLPKIVGRENEGKFSPKCVLELTPIDEASSALFLFLV
jgi:hypothetical protein